MTALRTELSNVFTTLRCAEDSLTHVDASGHAMEKAGAESVSPRFGQASRRLADSKRDSLEASPNTLSQCRWT